MTRKELIEALIACPGSDDDTECVIEHNETHFLHQLRPLKAAKRAPTDDFAERRIGATVIVLGII